MIKQEEDLRSYFRRTGKTFTLSLIVNFTIAALGWFFSFLILERFVAERTKAFAGIYEQPRAALWGLLVPLVCTMLVSVLFCIWLSSRVKKRHDQPEGAFVWAAFVPILISYLFCMCGLAIAAFD